MFYEDQIIITTQEHHLYDDQIRNTFVYDDQIIRKKEHSCYDDQIIMKIVFLFCMMI